MLTFNKFNKSISLMSLVQVLKNVGKSQKSWNHQKNKRIVEKIIEFLFFTFNM